MNNYHLVVHDRVRIAADYLVLRRSVFKPLTLANQKLDAGLQVLIAQKVYLSVALLRCKSQTEVSPHLTEILAVRGVDGAD